MLNKHIKGARFIATKRMPNNKITKRYSFTPTTLAKPQSLTLEELFSMWSKGAEPSVCGIQRIRLFINCK